MGNIEINDNLYNQAIKIAANEKEDLTKLVENFLYTYIRTKKEGKIIKVPTAVRNIGIPTNLTADYDVKNEYRNHLKQKYQ